MAGEIRGPHKVDDEKKTPRHTHIMEYYSAWKQEIPLLPTA